MRNKKSIIIGTLLAVVFVLFLNGLFQYLLALLFGVKLEEFQFSIFRLTPIWILESSTSIVVNSIMLLSSLAVTIIFVEFLFQVLKKSVLGLLRFSTITLLLFLSGYLMLFVFYQLIELILFPTNSSSFGKLVELWQIEGNQVYVVVVFILVILLTYLQIVQKRIMQYISVNKDK